MAAAIGDREAIDESAPEVSVAAAIEDREAIRQAQQGLKDLGLLDGKADGVAGKKTEAAVRAFQRQSGLPETGVLDAATFEAIRAARPSTATTPGLLLVSHTEPPLPGLRMGSMGNRRPSHSDSAPTLAAMVVGAAFTVTLNLAFLPL